MNIKYSIKCLSFENYYRQTSWQKFGTQHRQHKAVESNDIVISISVNNYFLMLERSFAFDSTVKFAKKWMGDVMASRSSP